jgi:ADP-L-glycero-D-manno-heptose 6-epimerase
MIVVTGGAGFIGSAFVAKLNAEGVADVIVVDEVTSPAREKNLAGKSYRQFIGKQEFIDSVRGNALSQGISAVVHMGACSSTTEKNLEYLQENNVEYSKTLAEYCLARGIRYIYASSAATYGDGAQGYEDDVARLESLKPLNPYGDSKQRMDLWAKENNILSKVVGLKFFNVYGPNEYYKGSMASIAWKAFNAIKETGSFSLFKSHRSEYRDGEQMRDFVYVKDCCDIMWWFLQNPTANGLFNVGSGKARSWNSLLTAIFSAMGKEPSIQYIEMPEDLRNQYQYFTEAPIQKLRDAGYSKPLRSLEEGITDYVQNYLSKPEQHW